MKKVSSTDLVKKTQIILGHFLHYIFKLSGDGKKHDWTCEREYQD